jgi:hypothetical protein
MISPEFLMSSGFRPVKVVLMLVLAGGVAFAQNTADARVNQAVNALRDPTVAGAGLQQMLQSGSPVAGPSRLLKIEIQGVGTNATPA